MSVSFGIPGFKGRARWVGSVDGVAVDAVDAKDAAGEGKNPPAERLSGCFEDDIEDCIYQKQKEIKIK
jgi:hypothetical protein